MGGVINSSAQATGPEHMLSTHNADKYQFDMQFLTFYLCVEECNLDGRRRPGPKMIKLFFY
ncbi:hypothetical protein GCM10009092_44140 [Bowmanella denitrificans]|uniref:Uncharacterized protein n=1 Tax=Bowmanella denitrificans TaxID=366582 RepID=A0ABN0XWL1_9ALTE